MTVSFHISSNVVCGKSPIQFSWEQIFI
uniref:Uncharacterized protein n=1 Tax=Arundo donax TaxID=35708 RepID=A0A0A8YX93_ARUDO